MKLFSRSALTLCVLLLPASAFALTLDEAKSTGLVGEESNGYVGAVQASTSPDISSLVAQVNGQRKDKYAEIAKKNGTTLAAVEALAGQKAIENSAPGAYVKRGAAGWTKK